MHHPAVSHARIQPGRSIPARAASRAGFDSRPSHCSRGDGRSAPAPAPRPSSMGPDMASRCLALPAALPSGLDPGGVNRGRISSCDESEPSTLNGRRTWFKKEEIDERPYVPAPLVYVVR
jgi:hypothetical protein